MIDVRHGDCLEIIPQLVGEGVLVDSVVTDLAHYRGAGGHSTAVKNRARREAVGTLL